MPPHDGSDLDHATWQNPTPRCPHGNEEPCPDCDQDRGLNEPLVCAHGKTVGEWCAACDVAGQEALAGWFVRLLDRVREREDETKGAALAARFGEQS